MSTLDCTSHVKVPLVDACAQVLNTMSVIVRLTRDWSVAYTESRLECSIIRLHGPQLAKTTSENWLIVGT